ncbi:MAG: hypothetical protein ISEC1_P0325 [Thiomicrorhabdus sp.]|nr:MAG: hypothetical protein ISEC1_P0325 [Thiomicrorhabdus sp.]
MDNYTTEPRRFEPRHDAHLSSLLINKGQELVSTIVNLSENGIGLISKTAIEANNCINILLGPHENPLFIKVDVRYCEAKEDEYYIGGKIEESCSGYQQLVKLIQ